MNYMNRGSRNHPMEMFFPIAIVFIFVAATVMILTLSSHVYDNTRETVSYNNSSRVAFAYVNEKLRKYDSDSQVRCRALGDSDCILLKDDDSTVYIYMQDGFLKELRAKSGADFTPDAGIKIAPVKSFAAHTEGPLCYVKITTEEGIRYSVVSSERSRK